MDTRVFSLTEYVCGYECSVLQSMFGWLPVLMLFVLCFR